MKKANTPRTLEQEAADEWREIQKFTDECRRLWPGAKITLRPNDTDEIFSKVST